MTFLIGGANSLTGGYEVDNSLRFNIADSTTLQQTYASTGTGAARTFTVSTWIKKCAGDAYLIGAQADSNNRTVMAVFSTVSGGGVAFENKISGTSSYTASVATFRDPAAWYHVVWAVDTTQGTDSNRVKIYINGEQLTDLRTGTGNAYPAENTVTNLFHDSNATYIGSRSGGNYYDGYMAELNIVDGLQLAPSNFGETNDNGVWVPKTPDVSEYGTNGGFYEFKQGTNVLGDATGRHLITPTNGATYNTSIKKFGSSSLYLDNTNNYLNITQNLADFGFGSAGSNSWTVEFWAYYLGNSSSGSDMIVDFDTPTLRVNYRPADPQFKVNVGGTEYAFGNNSPSLADDTWTHIAVVNESGTLKIYKDGTVDSTTHDVSGKTVASPSYGYIGYFDADTFDGHIDELRISDIARYTGNFSVQTSRFTSDSNTKLLLHMDDDKSFGADSSGKNNHFTPYNLNLLDSTTDTPTNNFCTLNPLANALTNPVTVSEGNLKAVGDSDTWEMISSTMGASKGKWYWEAKLTALGSYAHIGVTDDFDIVSGGLESYFGHTGSGIAFGKGQDATIYHTGISDTSYGTTHAAGNIISVALDLDNNFIYFAKNGTYQDYSSATGDPTSGASGTGGFAITANTLYLPAVALQQATWEVNYGNPSFAISSSNADADGYGNFEYAVPSGYFSWCTKNLAKYG